MGIETLLILAGVIMDSACENGTSCDGTGETLWKIGVFMLGVELLIVVLVAALGAGGTDPKRIDGD